MGKKPTNGSNGIPPNLLLMVVTVITVVFISREILITKKPDEVTVKFERNPWWKTTIIKVSATGIITYFAVSYIGIPF